MKLTRRIQLLCLLGIAISFAAIRAETTLVIHAGTLLVEAGEPPLTEQTVVITGQRISEIRNGYVAPADVTEHAEFLDLRDRFVLPGLMDMHVHLLLELSPDSHSRILTESDTLVALRGAANARTTLHAGFTTVRDLGGEPESIYALRDGIAKGLIPGPRIFAAGAALAATGGHGDVDGMRSDLMDLYTSKTICDGPYDCRRAVRYAVKHGADWIKITATGGVLSDTATGLNQQMTDDELAEIMDTAHSLGVKVAAHAHGTQGVNAALRAGVDTIDHGSFLDRESINLFKRNDAYLVPTLMPGHFLPLSMEDNPIFTEAIKFKANRASAAAKNSFRLALKSGVKIAFGTDTGVTRHGDNAKEFGLMVAEGMTPISAIRSATVTAAELLGLSDELGTVSPGKYADLIAVSGNPLKDINELERIRTVIKNGLVIFSR